MKKFTMYFSVHFTNQFTDFWVTMHYSTSTPFSRYVTNTLTPYSTLHGAESFLKS